MPPSVHVTAASVEHDQLGNVIDRASRKGARVVKGSNNVADEKGIL